jgi:hypothetical protein
VFSKKCLDKIDKYMNAHPEEKTTFDTMMAQRAERVNKAVKHFREEWKNVNPLIPIVMKPNDEEVLNVLEKAANVLKVEKEKSSGMLTVLEHERERTKLASQLVQEPEMFIMFQQAFFNSIMACGKDLMINTMDLDRKGNLTTVQRDTMGAIANTLVQELPFMQMDSPENIKKGFALFVSTLQKLNQFSKDNPDLMIKIGDKIQFQLDAIQTFIASAKAKLLDANVTETLREGLTGKFTLIEEHIQRITQQLKPLAPIVEQVVKPINEAQIKPEPLQAIEKQLMDLVFPIGEMLLKASLDLRQHNVPVAQQEELGKAGQDIMGLLFELLTERKNVAEVTEKLGGSLKSLSDFLKDKPEVAVRIGSAFYNELKSVFDFVKNSHSKYKQLFSNGPIDNLSPNNLNLGLATLAKESKNMENVLKNQAKIVIQNHAIR